MTTAMLIKAARAAGVELKLNPDGKVTALGKPAVVGQWTAVLRSNKSRITSQLEDALVRRLLHDLDAAGDWTDPTAVEELMERARREPQVRAYFLGRARELYFTGRA